MSVQNMTQFVMLVLGVLLFLNGVMIRPLHGDAGHNDVAEKIGSYAIAGLLVVGAVVWYLISR